VDCGEEFAFKVISIAFRLRLFAGHIDGSMRSSGRQDAYAARAELLHGIPEWRSGFHQEETLPHDVVSHYTNSALALGETFS